MISTPLLDSRLKTQDSRLKKRSKTFTLRRRKNKVPERIYSFIPKTQTYEERGHVTLAKNGHPNRLT